MSLRAFYAALGILSILLESGLLAAILARRQYKVFPVFTLYILFNCLFDVGGGVLAISHSAEFVRSFALGLLPLQYLLELAVLLEIAWQVLRPVRPSLPQGAIRVFIGLVVLSLLGGTLLAWHVNNTGNRFYDIKTPLDLTVGVLRMLIFGITAGFAQMLGIGWKNKVLQLATALSFYSAVDLTVSLAQSHIGGSGALERIRGLAYLLELGFLVWAFTTKDVRRREFSPQMEQFLVTLAGRAKLARTALVRMQVK
jgi:hypothetical protein